MRERILRATVIILLFGGIPAVSTAQTIELSSPDGRQIVSGVSAGAKLGARIDRGDVKGDIHNRDLIVSAPNFSSSTASSVGRVYVFFGWIHIVGDFSAADANVTLTGAAPGDQFGYSAKTGLILTREPPYPQEPTTSRDLVIGAPYAYGGKGAVYVFAGPLSNGALTPSNAVFTIIGAAPGDNLGLHIETTDLNGDRFREVAIASKNKVYVVDVKNAVAGGSTTLDLGTQSPLVTLTGLSSVTAMSGRGGDITGDGLQDLAVGDADAAWTGGAGAVYVIKGRASNAAWTTPTLDVTTSADARFTGERVGDHAGASLWSTDVDGDRIADLVIGAPDNSPLSDRPNAGSTYVLWGGPTMLNGRSLANADVKILGAAASYRTGAVLSLGDINRDDPGDVALLAPGANGGNGRIDVVYGRSKSAFAALGGVIDLGSMSDRIINAEPGFRLDAVSVFDVNGDGAEDIVGGVPSATTWAGPNAGKLYLSMSPSIAVGTASVTMVVNEGGAVSARETVINPTNVPITWSVASSVPWLSFRPNAGSAVKSADGSFDIVAASAGLPPGPYSGTVTVTSTSRHLVMSIAATVNFVVTATRVVIDSPAPGTTLAQPFALTGWALDRMATTNTGVDALHVYAFPNPGSGAAPIFLGGATSGYARPDVAAAFGGGAQFQNPGYRFSVAGLAPGPYRILVYAHHAATGVFTATASVDVTVKNNPLMFIDAPSPNATVPSALEISGWALDRASAAGPGVDAIHVYAYPNPGSGAGPVFLGVADYGRTRPDVGAAFGGQFTNAGYSLRVSGMSSGLYDLVVFARSTLSGQYDMMIRRVRVNATELITIDLPRAESTVGSSLLLGGWAIDRAAASGTGIDAVHIWAYPNSGGPAVFLGAAVYGSSRPDVGAVFGSQFTNSGFNLRVPSMVPGGYLFVAHAHNAALNAFAAPVTVRAQIVSSTLTTIDVPAVGQTTRPGASVSGWALNRDATSGTGIDAVHVWAYPNPGSGQAPAYIGVASYGVFRPDVGAAFGSSFNNAGFTITIPSLTPGEYLFVAFPHNVASNAFDPPATRRVTVTP